VAVETALFVDLVDVVDKEKGGEDMGAE